MPVAFGPVLDLGLSVPELICHGDYAVFTGVACRSHAFLSRCPFIRAASAMHCNFDNRLAERYGFTLFCEYFRYRSLNL